MRSPLSSFHGPDMRGPESSSAVSWVLLRDADEAGVRRPGGAKDYIATGKMTRGFAVVAYPAKYGDSGVMTLLIQIPDAPVRAALAVFGK